MISEPLAVLPTALSDDAGQSEGDSRVQSIARNANANSRAAILSLCKFRMQAFRGIFEDLNEALRPLR